MSFELLDDTSKNGGAILAIRAVLELYGELKEVADSAIQFAP